MRTPLIASVFLTFVLLQPVCTSFSGPPEDLEGSGSDLDSSGSGSGDWSEEAGETSSTSHHSSSKDAKTFAGNAGDRALKTDRGSSVLTFDSSHSSAKDRGSEHVVMSNSKSLVERGDILAGVIAGGVVGVIFAAGLAGLLIYKWQKKDDLGFIQGQQRDPDEHYHRRSGDDII